MSSTRIMLSIFGATSAYFVATKWKVATITQTGVINNAGAQGIFIKTNEMNLQRSEVANGNPDNDMPMSLYGNQELIKKAQKYCEEGAFVKVKYDKFFAANPFKASSSRKVLDIEEVTKAPEHAHDRKILHK